MTQEIVKEKVKKYLQRWLNQPGHKLTLLEDLSEGKVKYKTLSRLATGSGNVTPKVFAAIARQICSKDEGMELMEMLSEELTSLMKAWGVPEKVSVENGPPIIRDKTKLIVYSFCSKTNGTTHAEVNARFGDTGMVKLKELIEEGLVTAQSGRIFVTDNSVSYNEEFNKLSIDSLNDFCPTHCLTNKMATRYFMIEGVNRETAQDFSRKFRELQVYLKEKIKNTDCYGDITWIGTMVSEGFEPIEEKED